LSDLVILIQDPISDRDYERFGISFLKKKFNLSILDHTLLFRPHRAKNQYDQFKFKNENIKVIKSKNQSKRAINSLKRGTIVISYLNLNRLYKQDYIFRILDKNGIKYGAVICGSVPLLNVNFTIIERLHNFISSKNLFQKLIEKILDILISKKLNYNFFLVGGEVYKTHHPNLMKKNINIIKAHSFDYDKYLTFEKLNINTTKDNYAVFLDQFIPHHPDFYKTIYCERKLYYKSINAFFEQFERVHNLRVIIGAHPRADYHNYNPYEGRELVFSRTIELVKNSAAVLAHASTAINFAVLYKKKVILLSHPNYHKLFKSEIMSFSKALKTSVVDLSKKNFKKLELKVEKEDYLNYVQKYIKEKDSPENSIWEIFCNYFEKT
tara:strand:+ start:129 stop:1271 length:1143 start_codon:yes stop_codon:yes gene_type:complete